MRETERSQIHEEKTVRDPVGPLPLTLLTGCGGNGAADGFLDTLKEAKNQKDYQLELISAEDETWETGKKLTGTVSRSNSQAELTLTAFGKGDKTLGTVKILVDGKDIYLKLDDWITYLNQQFKDMTTDSEDYADDIQTLQEVAQKLDGKYVKLSVSEDTFTLWEKSEGASGAFSEWYNGLGKALKNSVTEKARCRLEYKEDTKWKRELSFTKARQKRFIRPTIRSFTSLITRTMRPRSTD